MCLEHDEERKCKINLIRTYWCFPICSSAPLLKSTLENPNIPRVKAVTKYDNSSAIADYIIKVIILTF